MILGMEELNVIIGVVHMTNCLRFEPAVLVVGNLVSFLHHRDGMSKLVLEFLLFYWEKLDKS